MMTWLLAVAAAAVALWPTQKKGGGRGLLDDLAGLEPPPKKAGNYLDAVAALQIVRARLVHTDELSDEAVEALNTLTLSLAAGSDEE